MRVLRIALCGACVALAGCAELISGRDAGAAQVTRVALFDGSLIAAGPQGYCVAPWASRPADGFAVLAGCDVIAGTASPGASGGFITVQVGAGASALGAETADLGVLLGSAAGQAVLSQTGDADDITVQAIVGSGGGLTVRFVDRAAPPVQGLQQTEWRGFLDLRDRLTTVSVRGLAAAPLGTDEGQQILSAVMQALRQVNGVTADGSDT